MMDPYKVLFVCWGNICRSPAAECVLQQIIEARGLGDKILCDSAGTISAHNGQPPDRRMQEHAARRSIPFCGRARGITPGDFEKFDLIIAMDRENMSDLESYQRQGATGAELKLFGHFLNPENPPDVPDPYYGGSQGFERVLDMVEEGCSRIVQFVLNR